MTCYLLRAGETDNVKIGSTHSVKDRMTALQSGCWERLTLLRTWPGGRITEGWLHRRFSANKIDRDWFRFDPDMLDVEPPTAAVITSGSNPVESIIERLGGQTAVARLLGTKQSTVWDWVNKRRLPSSRIIKIIDAAMMLDPPVVLQPNDFFATGVGSAV